MSICDCAIAIGGDGTTLNIAKKAAFLGKPALGINAGRLGFMSGIERDELGLLARLIMMCIIERVQSYLSDSRSNKSYSRSMPTPQTLTETPVEHLYNHPFVL